MSTAPRTMQLLPPHWKQLALLNAMQLQDFINSIPSHTEAGASALTDEAMAIIDGHLQEGRAFLQAWKVSRMPTLAAPQQKVAQPQANGAAQEKCKGGWPKGKPRKPAQTEQQQ